VSDPIEQKTKPPEYGAMRALLMEIRRRHALGDAYHPADTVKLIDALFAGDVRYQIRQIIGDRVSLTARQWDLLEALFRYRQVHDVSPTLQELGNALGVSKVTIHETVQVLLRKGVLRHEEYEQRDLTISRPPHVSEMMPARARAAQYGVR
jgi:DNA-binding MarR family transcriptional regulator